MRRCIDVICWCYIIYKIVSGAIIARLSKFSLNMMREFLEAYSQAINLDEKQYDRYFPPSVKRSDFLLFNKQAVCEFKEFQSIEIKSRVEKISRKGNISEKDLKDDLYKRIERCLSDANKQIKDTKNTLKCSDAFGVVILENLMPNDLSVLSLIDAADRKMLRGLDNVDCVLCLDFVNTFSNSEGQPIRYAQTVSRDTEKAKMLYELLNQLMTDFCNQLGIPLLKEFEIERGEQVWLTDENGKYKTYKAKLDFKLPVSEVKLNWRQRLAQFIDKWWWVIPLPAILYDWFIR